MLFVSGVPCSRLFGHRIEAICARSPCFPTLWAQNWGFLCRESLFLDPLGTKPGLFVSGVTFFRPFGHKTGAFRVRSPCFPTLWAQNRCFSCSEHHQIRNSGAKQALFAPDRRYLCISGAKTPQFAPEKHLPLRFMPERLPPLRFKTERLPQLRLKPEWLAPLRLMSERLPPLAFLSATRKARSVMKCQGGGWKGYWRALLAQIAARSVA